MSAARARPLLLISVVGALSFLNAFALAARLAQTSDSVQAFVAGYAVAHGNILLSGWHFPFNDYYFTDTIPYALLEWVFGPRPILLAFVPALTYAVFVCVALFFSLGFSVVQTTRSAALIAVLVVSPAWIGTWNPVLMSDMHFTTVVFALIALGLTAMVLRNSGRSRWVVRGALVLVVTLATASDPFSLVFAFVPAMAVLAADSFSPNTIAHEGRHALGAVGVFALFAGIALGLLLPAIIARVDGFTVERDVVTNLVSVRGIAQGLSTIGFGLLSLFGINGFLAPMGPLALLGTATRAIGALLAGVAVARTAPGLLAPSRTPLLDRMLVAGIFATLVACAASAQFSKGITDDWTGGPPMRYVMPVFLFAVVLAGRQVSEILCAASETATRFFPHGSEKMRGSSAWIGFALALLAGLAVIVGDASISAKPRWIDGNPPARAVQWLENRGLAQGVGEYWSANLVTAMSGNAVQVRSVLSEGGGLVAYAWSANARAYARKPEFVIWQDGNKTGMTLSDVRASYRVCDTALVAGYRIAILATHEVSNDCTAATARTRP